MDTLVAVNTLPDANKHGCFYADDERITSHIFPTLNLEDIDNDDIPFWDDFVCFEVENSEELHAEESQALFVRTFIRRVRMLTHSIRLILGNEKRLRKGCHR
jgi:hypothetical protein